MSKQNARTDVLQPKGYITLDGERFFLDIPTMNMWSARLVQELGPIFASTREAQKVKTILASPVTKAMFFRNVWGGLSKRADAEAAATDPNTERTPFHGWRPVLIPEKYLVDEPDGTILTGGTWYMDGEAKPPVSNDGIMEIPLFPGDHVRDLTIGDTVAGKELHWVVWKGWLICQHVLLALISHEELRRFGYGLFPGNSPHMPTIKDGPRTLDDIYRETEQLI